MKDRRRETEGTGGEHRGENKKTEGRKKEGKKQRDRQTDRQMDVCVCLDLQPVVLNITPPHTVKTELIRICNKMSFSH